MDSNDGLIFAYIMDGDGGGSAVDRQGISDWRPEKGLLWIHLDYSNEQVKQWLQTESKLSGDRSYSESHGRCCCRNWRPGGRT